MCPLYQCAVLISRRCLAPLGVDGLSIAEHLVPPVALALPLVDIFYMSASCRCDRVARRTGRVVESVRGIYVFFSRICL